MKFIQNILDVTEMKMIFVCCKRKYILVFIFSAISSHQAGPEQIEVNYGLSAGRLQHIVDNDSTVLLSAMLDTEFNIEKII